MSFNSKKPKSLGTRLILFVMLMSLGISSVISIAGYVLHKKIMMKNYFSYGENIVNTVANLIDAEASEQYLETLVTDDAYEYVASMMHNIQKNNDDIQVLFISQFQEDGQHIIFKFENNFSGKFSLGYVSSWEDSFGDNFPEKNKVALSESRISEPELYQLNNSSDRFFIFSPLHQRNNAGMCGYYAGAKFKIHGIESKQRYYILFLSIILVLSNVLFFILYWLIIKSKIIVPVNSLVTAAKNYFLDDNINKDHFAISSLSITTGDELEILADSLKNIEKKVQKYTSDLNEASRRASTDFLTGLHNREAFYNGVNEFLQKRIPGKLHAFIVLDIDRFKEINDTYGHPVGDEVLKKFAVTLQAQFRNSDDIARMGGDEFTVFCGNIGSRRMVEHKAQLIKQAASMIYPAEGAESITVSIGITILSDKPVDYETLFQKADAALYQSKIRGRNDYTIELL